MTNAGRSWCLEGKETLLSSEQPSHSSRVTPTLTLSGWIDRMRGRAQTGPLWARVMPALRLHTVTIQTRYSASAGIYENSSNATQKMPRLSFHSFFLWDCPIWCTKTFLKILSCMFHKKTKQKQVCNDMKGSKYWRKDHFWVNCFLWLYNWWSDLNELRCL